MDLAAAIEAYRTHTYRSDPSRRLRSVGDALAFVEQRGFVMLWPLRDLEMPSLWCAAAGDRPVADAHDDPGHITWGWKDEMLDQRRWYYGKLLRGKATVVALRELPHFYALSPRLADLDDYRQAYHDGQLSHEARRVADVLLREGAQDTIELRQKSGLSGSAHKSRFNRALIELQRGLWILPVGIARTGGWRYAFRYELFDRWFPDVSSRAAMLSDSAARSHLAERYLASLGAASTRAVTKTFGWSTGDSESALSALVQRGDLLKHPDLGWIHKNVLAFQASGGAIAED